jgi:transposase
VRLRTRVKNRIHATLARFNVQIPGADLFGVAARRQLAARLPELPEHSREAVEQELATLDFLETQIESAEQRLQAIMQVSVETDLLKTLPCVGPLISVVLMLESGRVDRFRQPRTWPATPGWCRGCIPAVATHGWDRSAGM